MVRQVESYNRLETNSMQWKVGTRLITVTRDQDPQEPEIISATFQKNYTVDQISVQRMKKMAKEGAVFLVIIRTIENEEEQTNQKIVTVNEDNTKTSFLDQVQVILEEFADIVVHCVWVPLTSTTMVVFVAYGSVVGIVL